MTHFWKSFLAFLRRLFGPRLHMRPGKPAPPIYVTRNGRRKLTRAWLLSFFPAYGNLGGYTPLSATKPGYKHQHRPTYRPPASRLTPAQFHRMNRELRNRRALERLQNSHFFCPTCWESLPKLGWCAKDRLWAVPKP